MNEAYSSLYKKEGKKEKEKDPDTEGKPEVDRSARMWKVVEAAMESNHLGELREGRLRRKSGSKNGGIGEKSGATELKQGLTREKKQTRVASKKDKKTKEQKTESGRIDDVREDDEAMGEEDETGAGFFE